MKLRREKKIDSQGRINIPLELLEFVEINNEHKVALCLTNTGIKLKSTQFDLQNEKIIGFVNIDEKGRFVIPKYLLEKGKKKFSIYILNKELIIESVDS